MSNRPNGVKIHPANKLSNKEIGYNTFIRGMIRLSKRFGFSKHVGSKSISILRHRTIN